MRLRAFAGMILLLALTAIPAGAAPAGDLAKAAKDGKVAFIVVTEPGATGVDAAKDMIRAAMKQVKRSVLVEIDRSNPQNAELVSKYRLAGAPVPLILVAGGNGSLAGGLPAAQATSDRLVSMVPSPKKAEILHALQEGKAVFIAIARKSMAAQPTAMSACAVACGQMPDKSATVQIDMDDPAEAVFLAQMKVDRGSTEPVTLVINPQGQIAGSFTGAADVTALVQAASARAGGCCPSTVQNPNASCGPPK